MRRKKQKNMHETLHEIDQKDATNNGRTSSLPTKTCTSNRILDPSLAAAFQNNYEHVVHSTSYKARPTIPVALLCARTKLDGVAILFFLESEYKFGRCYDGLDEGGFIEGDINEATRLLQLHLVWCIPSSLPPSIAEPERHNFSCRPFSTVAKDFIANLVG